MRRLRLFFALIALLLALPALSLADTRALLVACSDFVTQPDLGNAISGNLQMIASALLGVSPGLAGLSIEDGTLADAQALSGAIEKAFSDADEEDLSILYLCTHGISSSDDGQTYLLLSDGQSENMLSSSMLCDMLAPIQGEKVLIVDACFSGALIGRGDMRRPGLPLSDDASAAAPFLLDPSIHVLTSADGYESSWYYDSAQLSTGAVSYFASALASGLGLYGTPEADIDGDGQITLAEIHRYLSVAVPSSSSQLLSADADAIALPAVKNPMLSRPLAGFSYGASLLASDDPAFDFSFTVTEETAVQYRLIDFDEGRWNWENAKTFLDAGENEAGTLSPGRKTRTLTLSDVAPGDSGYLMLQVFSLSGEELILCSERLIAVQPAQSDAALSLSCADTYVPGGQELPIAVHLGVPAEITLSVHNAEGELVRRLSQSQLTRPAPGDVWHVSWDGRDDHGYAVQSGAYTVTAETTIRGRRLKAAANVSVAR